ncbi:hypothetical protein, variant [Phialophora macrospora]|uniref:Transcriptional coactivator p15 (PC4) C-terminal domain-containing protein n=1 Tax=Phialophora macrospora TaxID=1851006 RepID=A0A0D2FRA9_9EURO|nr:hypothetical protein PV04_04963 [Phialophora macrospora]KIW69065.1 hypothetical protein, variant [Phialophora macrospora]
MKTKSKSKSRDKPSSSPSTSTPKKDHLKNPSHPYTFEHLHNAYITSLSHANTMPFTKKRKSAADSDVDEVSTTKRGKGASGNAFRPSSKVQIDADGNKFWEIAKTRRVTISEFKGQTMVGIREYYEKDGQWLPGKKGISLTLEQYSALIQVTPQIEDLLKSQGKKVPRPNYSGNVPTEDDDQSDDGGQKDVKLNIDATSDEDE